MFYAAIFCLLLCLIQKSSSVNYLEQLRDNLLVQNKYNKHVRPEQSADTNTTIFMTVLPLYLTDYDEYKSLLILDTFIYMDWNDTRLKWDPKMFGGHKQMNFENGALWQPDIAVYNGHSSNIDPKVGTRTIVISSGTVIWVTRATITAYCHPEDLHLYPRDIQQCDIILGPWTEHGLQLDIQKKEGDLGFGRFTNSNPRWELLQDKFNVSRKDNYFDCCAEPYVSLEVNFYLMRRYPPHLTVLWLPCILVMILTLSLFWIPLFSGKKAALGGILFLSITIMMVHVAGSTKPPTAQIYAVSFIQITMCAVTAAIVLEILVMNLAHIGHPYRPPGFLISILSSTVSKWFLVWSPLQPTESTDQIHLQGNENDKAVTPSYKHEWIMVATALDRILFLIFLVVFLTVH